MYRLFEGSSFDETHETCISQGTVARCFTYGGQDQKAITQNFFEILFTKNHPGRQILDRVTQKYT